MFLPENRKKRFCSLSTRVSRFPPLSAGKAHPGLNPSILYAMLHAFSLKFPTLSTWFSTQKALFLHEKDFACGKLPRCIPLHINFSTYGPIVDFQAPFKEKLWKT